MKAQFLFVAMLTAMILAGGRMQAQETFTHEQAGVEITIPAGWYYEHQDSDFTIYTPGKELAINLAVMEATGIDQALEQADADLEKNFKQVKLGDARRVDANGMECVEIDGTAMLEGQPVVVYYCLVVTPKGKILEISAVGTDAEFDKYGKEIEQLDNSLKPVK
jgi:hypothetical protein